MVVMEIERKVAVVYSLRRNRCSWWRHIAVITTIRGSDFFQLELGTAVMKGNGVHGSSAIGVVGLDLLEGFLVVDKLAVRHEEDRTGL